MLLSLQESTSLRSRISSLLAHSSSPLVAAIASFLDETLGQSSSTVETVRETWSSIEAEIAGVKQRESALAVIQKVSMVLEECGCPLWAKDLREQEPVGQEDHLIPSNWRDAWDWANGNEQLSRLPSSTEIRALAERLVPLQRKGEIAERYGATRFRQNPLKYARSG